MNQRDTDQLHKKVLCLALENLEIITEVRSDDPTMDECHSLGWWVLMLDKERFVTVRLERS